MNDRKKATQLEKEQRIFKIQGWIIDGVQDYLIKKQVMSWGIQGRQAERYIAEAYSRWKKDESIDINQRRDARIAELKQDIRGMDEKMRKTPLGLRTMLAFKKELSKLEDLYPAKKHIISGDPERPLHVSPFKNEQEEAAFKEFLKNKYNFE